jgi:hypothetical protein
MICRVPLLVESHPLESVLEGLMRCTESIPHVLIYVFGVNLPRMQLVLHGLVELGHVSVYLLKYAELIDVRNGREPGHPSICRDLHRWDQRSLDPCRLCDEVLLVVVAFKRTHDAQQVRILVLMNLLLNGKFTFLTHLHL